MKKFSLLLLFVVLSLAPIGVLAHAELRSAVPGPGETVVEQPGEIRLTFSETVGPGSNVTLFGEDFREVEGVEIRLESQQPEMMTAIVPELEPGTYSVDWMVISTDGHPATGSYTFAFTPELDNGYTIGVILGTIAAVTVLAFGAWGINRLIRKNGG